MTTKATISDEAVEAAFRQFLAGRDEWIEAHPKVLGLDEAVKSGLRNALEAAYPHITPHGIVVKGLEWQEVTSPREDGPREPTGDLTAQALGDEYLITLDLDEDVAETPWCCWSLNENLGHFGTVEEAKAAAQDDYEKIVLSALQRNPEGEVEPVAWPDRWSVDAKTGFHVGLWSDEETAQRVAKDGGNWHIVTPLYIHPPRGMFKRGDHVEKKSGSSWHGVVVGEYSSSLTAEGYCVESEREPGSVQLYPVAALSPKATKGDGV